MKRAQRLGAFLAALGLLVLSACDDGDDPPADPSATSSSPSADDTPDEDPSASGSAAAASGEAMVTDDAYVHAPEEWPIERQLEGVLDSWVASQDRSSSSVYITDFGATDAQTLRQFVRFNKFSTFEGRPEVTYDAELGGEPAYHVVGRGSTGPREAFGALRGGVAVTVTFQMGTSLSAAERQQLIESVLASFRWT